MFTQKERAAIRAFEDAADAAGGYLAPCDPEGMQIGYNYKALSTYCREFGIRPADLTMAEIAKFEIKLESAF
jgi:hypothetical protein